MLFGDLTIKKYTRNANNADKINEVMVDLISLGLFECVPVV